MRVGSFSADAWWLRLMAKLMRGSILTSAVRDAARRSPLGELDVKRAIDSDREMEILVIFFSSLSNRD